MTSAQRVAVVTGAGSGLGRAVALALGGRGYAVVSVGRRAVALSSTVDEMLASGHVGVAVPTDVTDESQVDSLFDEVRGTFGRIDLLVNNAGRTLPTTRIDEIALSDWESVVQVNVSGAFLCTRAAFRLMRSQVPQGGRIINIGSVAVYAARMHSAAYTTSKHGLTGLTMSTSIDGREFDITCCQINIGNAATDMTETMASGMLQPDGSHRPEPTFDAAYVGQAVSFMADIPPEANVQFMTLAATKMPLWGRG